MGDENHGMFCECCGVFTNYDNQHFTKHHLKKEHGLSSEEYYRKYILKDGDDMCKTCGCSLKFKSIERGFGKGYCSNTCVLSNSDVQISIQKTQIQNQFEKYGMYYDNYHIHIFDTR